MSSLYSSREAPDWDRPDGVVLKKTDPATGLLLTAGCRPAHGKARAELFIEGTQPPRSCPAGEPTAGDQGVFRRVGTWLGERFQHIAIWLRRHVGSERPTKTPNDDRYLGAPRLPRAADVPQTEITPEEYDLQTLDSMQMNTIRVPIDSVSFDPLFVDSALRDTLQPDTAQPDSLPDPGLPQPARPVSPPPLPVPDTLPREMQQGK